ncbi:MAG: GGDEF domain-containing phosphodiesterase [Clostridia bacterium]|nr:GGDEF domain-containing phosphodiesterase [Clostridia bacterium]
MQFDVQFDITALFFLSIIIIKYFSQKQFPLLSTKLYGNVLIAAAVSIFFSIAGSLSLGYAEFLPIRLCYALNYLYFVALLTLPPAIFLYILAMVAPEAKLRIKDIMHYAVPAFAAEIAITIAFALGKLFTILPDGTYVRGPLTRLTYIETTIYVAASFIALFRFRKLLSPQVSRSISALSLLVIFCSCVQYALPHYSVTSIAIVAALLIVLFTLESPESMADNVTGLNNYKAFELILRTRYHMGERFKIVVTEIHGLRKVNTIYGIKAGDKLLRDIADYLDPGRDTWVFRIAPTRFAMMAVKEEAYNRYLKKVNDRADYFWPVNETETAQIIFDSCHIDHADAIESTEALLNIIDRAMDESHEWEGTGAFELNEEVVARIDRRTKLHLQITGSIAAADHFKLYYQPIYNCKEGRFTSAEALLRYDHPDFGLVSPGEFLPIVSDAGMQLALDKMVIDLAIKDIKSGLFDNLEFDKVNINLTSATLLQPDYVMQLIDKIKAAEVDPRLIVFEITEEMAVKAKDDLKESMFMLKIFGIRFAIDDFGTGYSNMSTVVELPFDFLKFDKSLFSLGKTYEHMVSLMQKLCSATVSEGVETAEQAELVKSLGIDYIQGYYYAKPMEAEKLKDFILNRESR